MKNSKSGNTLCVIKPFRNNFVTINWRQQQQIAMAPSENKSVDKECELRGFWLTRIVFLRSLAFIYSEYKLLDWSTSFHVSPIIVDNSFPSPPNVCFRCCATIRHTSPSDYVSVFPSQEKRVIISTFLVLLYHSSWNLQSIVGNGSFNYSFGFGTAISWPRVRSQSPAWSTTVYGSSTPRRVWAMCRVYLETTKRKYGTGNPGKQTKILCNNNLITVIFLLCNFVTFLKSSVFSTTELFNATLDYRNVPI